MYAILLKGYGPGVIWTWRESLRAQHEMIHDALPRRSAIFPALRPSAPTHKGQSRGLAPTKVQFQPDTRKFHIVARDQGGVDPNGSGAPGRGVPKHVDVAPLVTADEKEAQRLILGLRENMPTTRGADAHSTPAASHFLLQDLVTDDGEAIDFFMSFDDFKKPHVPRDVETYRDYRRRSIEFVRARNRRIDDDWARREEH